HLVLTFTEPYHQAGFGQCRAVVFCKTEHVEGLLIIGLGAHAAIQATDCFHIVIENMRSRIQHPSDGMMVAAEIGREYFYPGLWQYRPYLTYRFSKMIRTAIRQIVAIHGCNNDIAKLHARGHLGDMMGLIRIERKLAFGGRALGNRAESAPARAQIAQNHERSSAPVEALVNVRTAGGLADRMQTPLAELGF